MPTVSSVNFPKQDYLTPSCCCVIFRYATRKIAKTTFDSAKSAIFPP